MLTKQPRQSFKRASSTVARPLQLLRSDVCEMSTTALGGAKYFCTLLDDHSGICAIGLLASKADVPTWIGNTITRMERESGLQAQALRTDNGSEYANQRLHDHLSSRGIEHQTSAPYTPEHNGKAERLNRVPSVS